MVRVQEQKDFIKEKKRNRNRAFFSFSFLNVNGTLFFFLIKFSGWPQVCFLCFWHDRHNLMCLKFLPNNEQWETL